MDSRGFFSRKGNGNGKPDFVRTYPGDDQSNLQMSSLSKDPSDMSNLSDQSTSVSGSGPASNNRSVSLEEVSAVPIASRSNDASLSYGNNKNSGKRYIANKKISGLSSLDRLSANEALAPLIDDSSDGVDRRKVVVYILSKDPNSENTKRAVKIFDNDFFHVIIIHNENQDWMKKYPHHAEKSYYASCFKQAHNKYPNNYVVIVRDSSVSSVSPSEIAQTIRQAINSNNQWHLLYLSRWNDNCAALTPLEDGALKNGNASLVHTIEPHGMQAVVFSPEARKIFDGSRNMKNGENFPCELATSENEAKKIDEILSKRSQLGEAVGEAPAQTAAVQASAIGAAQNAGAQVKAVSTSSSSSSSSGSYLVQAYTFEDCVREHIAKGNLNAITTTYPLIYYDNRNGRNHHRMNVCRPINANGSYVENNSLTGSTVSGTQNTTSFLFFFIGFIILLIIIALIIWAVNKSKKEKLLVTEGIVGSTSSAALPVVKTPLIR